MNDALTWFKSSYSNTEGGACVEIALTSSTVRVRDSKDRTGPQLAFTAQAWADFLAFTQNESPHAG
ncbi:MULTISPECIES: DUF397 domain-containing protein [Kitasatospora]|uniref:DUF397 domain-containing protein n=1 Tax=Kitasatospora cathayae TaxID=3004092 RepID=A0ABY7Q0Q4_9ACTN|nr:DUF397 domain-containing protein [Kitasatospora sp. HUAS 3-15]WBP86034.1 DUF397 domain-containing protein [Kitasatospora sp. HUAS 3-15]